jgi:hypothetical protein
MSRRHAALVLALAIPTYGLSLPGDNSLGALAASLRPIIMEHLPTPLYERSENWDHQVEAFERITWRRLRPQVVKTLRNDGRWQKTRVTTLDPQKTLEFHISDLRSGSAGQLTFKVFAALMVNVEHEEELWERGLRLYRDTTEARVRIKGELDIESTMRLEKSAQSFIPDTVFRLHVTKANVSYDNLVTEHIAGIGGTGARWIGEALRSTLKQWKPSIERELLAKADAAVIKAADTKEVRISLGNVFSQYGK